MDTQRDEFLSEGARKRGSLVTEYLHLLRTTRKWWALPLILVLLALAGLTVLSSTAAAPFIYTLF